MAASILIACPACEHPLTLDPNSLAINQPCPACATQVYVQAFPAALAPPQEKEKAAPLATGHEATCYLHPTSKAQAHCAHCGRLICPICAIESLNGDTRCPECLDAPPANAPAQQQTNSRIRKDSLALALAMLPILLFLPTTLFAIIPAMLGFDSEYFPFIFVPFVSMIAGVGIASTPISMFAIPYLLWTARGETTDVLHRGKWRYRLAALLLIAQILFWAISLLTLAITLARADWGEP